MPEPRETHTAIDARRAEPCIAGKEFHDEWIADLCALIPEGDESRYSNPEGAVEAIILDCFRVYAAERDALAETVRQVRDLFSGGPDTPCRTTWRRVDLMLPGDSYSVECVEVPMDDLRAALDAAPSDPATDTGGEPT